MAVNTNLGVSATQLPSVANLAVTDSFVVVYNTTGNLSVRLASLGVVGANLIVAQFTPSNSGSAGVQGTIAYDSHYFYVCTSNGWLRTSLASF